MRSAVYSLIAVLSLASCGASEVFRGEVSIYIADYPDGHSETQRFLLMPDGSERRLWFTGSPRLQPGDVLEVRGQAAGDEIAVGAFTLAARHPLDELTGDTTR